MVIIIRSNNFDRAAKKFVKNNTQRASALLKTVNIFRHNPQHPSLSLEKLYGTKVWTIRIDKGNRIYLKWINNNTALLIDVGSHDRYRKYS